MIERLAPHLVNQIAAGEVVERPASVVKELVENALDAGGTRLKIEVEAGGLKMVAVEDNGEGMAAEDLPLAFAPHSTSKLRQISDFDSLETYGFRGEAIASIASVGDTEIWTTRRSKDVSSSGGLKGRVSFGASAVVDPADSRVGTRVQVRGLFENHPARLKFLKSARAEYQAIHQLLKKYALARPEIAWDWSDRETGKGVHLEKASSLDRVLWFFDAEELSHLWLDCQHSTPEWKLRIFTLQPRALGKLRPQIHVFLNHRPIKDIKIDVAVRRALEGFTENPREAVAVVFLEGDPKLYDVNVHPMKWEVRFLNSESLFSAVVACVRNSLKSLHRNTDEFALGNASESSSVSWGAGAAASIAMLNSPLLRTVQRTPIGASDSVRPLPADLGTLGLPMVDTPDVQHTFFKPANWEYMGNLDETYLLVRKSSALYIFDQHALHERILYERLLKAFQKQDKLEKQRLLFPLSLDHSFESLTEREDLLDQLGFELRPWADGKLQVVSVPALLKRGHKEVLEALQDSLQLPLETLARPVLSTMACHSAVRAHDRLSLEEISKLLEDFESEDAVGHCPHGRPTFVRFEKRDFEKLFHRIL